ncbi:hypothetical protein FCT18_16665 [Lysinibacillus sphaericus]|uniref:Uncharacterized protein n=3 Tax=Lysinibacillus TaxID=400634 RepID=A0A2S0JVJ5_LYSSH|nr:hypothetical protein T479_22435 [Lysinibacillus varians]AVK95079.1 hypothetical protein LS41612_01595 [Lysinibacillus sphaericus]TKI46628.1 hypothetical protein FC748_17200 [Lysinibacillus tabacifolii]TKI17861.1 hypothetical protein FCT18_16665 [Lysinibacillus sphaericus]TKI62013.1 hypothetical protein FC752_13425 [Lysinibacillus varians]
MHLFIENIKDITFLIILLSSFIYRRQLKLTKWKRKLTKGEMLMYFLTSIALPIYGVIYCVQLLAT